MNKEATAVVAPERAPISFADLPVTAAEHFKLCWFGATLQVALRTAEALERGDHAAEEFPFLGEYVAQMRQRGVVPERPGALAEWWRGIEQWEGTARCHLPLRALRTEAGLSWPALGALLTAGLLEDDPRFARVFALLQGGTSALPTAGLLSACWSENGTGPVRRLQELGLLHLTTGKDPRHAWEAQVPGWVWDALTDSLHTTSGAGWSFDSHAALGENAPELVLPTDVEASLDALTALAENGEVRCVIVRGPRGSGRRSVLRCLAMRLGRGLLTLDPPLKPDDDRWNVAGPLATVLGALPAAEFELGSGETMRLPRLTGYAGPLAVKLGRRGGLAGEGAERAVTLELGVPPPALRRALWRRQLPSGSADIVGELASRHRLPAGRIVELACHGAARAALVGHATPTAQDFVDCARRLHREELDSLAVALTLGGDWCDLALPDDVLHDLRALEARCRHRERLASEDHRFAPNAGVRALLSGPSGTGKTLAACVLARSLGMDVYRVDLSSVVNKYIGETEKNLDRVLSLAEELDILLLIDEGDALLAQRTAVQSSNDRYANLETNFLLQRLETFEGIVFITTNAGDRVDGAFQRRMDAIIEFRSPDATERRRLWDLHLPDGYRSEDVFLDRLSAQCVLTGAQIRNAALHARLLALDDGGVVTSHFLVDAVRREYRKLGAPCPMPSQP